MFVFSSGLIINLFSCLLHLLHVMDFCFFIFSGMCWSYIISFNIILLLRCLLLIIIYVFHNMQKSNLFILSIFLPQSVSIHCSCTFYMVSLCHCLCAYTLCMYWFRNLEEKRCCACISPQHGILPWVWIVINYKPQNWMHIVNIIKFALFISRTRWRLWFWLKLLRFKFTM